MSNEEDPLEGFRAPEEPNYSDAEAKLLAFVTEKRGILELINAGLDMERFLSTPAGKAVWNKAEGVIAESIAKWLECHDPGTEAARAAHFNASVAVQVLKTFQDTIDTGREMGQQLRTEDDEESNDGSGRNRH